MVMEAGGWLNGSQISKKKRFYICDMASQKTKCVLVHNVENRIMDLALGLT